MEIYAKRQSCKDNISASTSLPSASSRTHQSDKLQAIFDRQKAKYELQMVQNRVNKLLKLKQEADKEIAKLSKKIKEEQGNNEWKRKRIELRRKTLDEKQEFMERRRRSINFERAQRRKSIQEFENKILLEKKTIVKEKRERTSGWNKEIYVNRSVDLEEKAQRFKKIKKGYVKSLRQRCFTQRSNTQRVKEEYFQSIQQEKLLELEAAEQINELEHAESNLIEDLSRTIEVRRALLENLSKVKAELSKN